MPAVSVAEARAAVLAAATVQPSLRLKLEESIGHLLATDVVARWPLPSWTAASMDGYAVHSADLEAGVTLPLSGGGDAGDPPPPRLGSGTAWRVATGGRVPEGADTVIRVEDTELVGGAVLIRSDRDRGRNIRPAGGDVKRGDTVLRAGAVVTPAVIGVLAALGEANPVVYRRSRVAIITSGDEVVALDQVERLAAGERIVDANAPMLAALVRESGGVPLTIGPVADSTSGILAAVEAARDTDLVLSAGAISVGQRDLVPDAMRSVGAVERFRRIRLRPGGPTTLAVLPDGRAWLALPGNPVSAFVTFTLFGRPMIRKMMGDPEPLGSTGRAVLAERVVRDPVLDMYVRVTLGADAAGGLPVARLAGHQGSWVTTALARADALAVIEAGDGAVEAGASVATLPTTANRGAD